MWGNQTDAERLIALRREVLGAVTSSPFTGPVRLTLTIHVGDQAPVVTNAGKNGFGDLDNFVGGVCDGLMAADPSAKPHGLFDQPENTDVDPKKKIAMVFSSNQLEGQYPDCQEAHALAARSTVSYEVAIGTSVIGGRPVATNCSIASSCEYESERRLEIKGGELLQPVHRGVPHVRTGGPNRENCPRGYAVVGQWKVIAELGGSGSAP